MGSTVFFKKELDITNYQKDEKDIFPGKGCFRGTEEGFFANKS